jgi:hypothetical protein
MALTGPDCAKAVYGQVTMQFYGGNQIQEAPEAIVDALNLVASHPAGTGGPFALSIRVLDANGLSLNCCPDGYVFDAAARTCVLKPVVINPPPPPKPPPPPPAPPPVDAGGDELTVNFSLLFNYLIQLIESIKVLTQPQTGASAETCCTHIIATLVSLTKAVQQIGVKLGQPGAPPPPAVDLSGVLTELQCLCTNLTAISQSSAAVANDLGPGLQSIAQAVANTKPTDTKPIVDAINAFAKIVDIKQPVIDYLVKNGLLDSQMAQIAGSADLGDTLANFYSKYGKYLIAGGLDTVGGSIASGHVIVPDPNIPAKRDMGAVFGSMLKNVDSVFDPLLQPIVTGLLSTLAPAKVPPIGQAGVSLDAPAATAFGVAFTAAAASYIMSFFGIDAGATLAWIAELLAGAVGWEELRDLHLKPYIQYGIQRVVQMEAKSRFQQELPGNGELANWTARGLMDSARADELMALNGLHFSLRPIAHEAAEQGLAPFILLRLANTGLFTQSDLVDEMTFKGLRPASQHRILLAAPFLASQKERDALRATLEKAYAGGLFTDLDFTTRVGALEQETDRARLMLERGRIERGLFVLKEIEDAYETEFLAGITDAPTYQSKLQGLGLQLDYVTGIMAKAEAHANARLLRQAAASERALQKATHAAERRAALEQFRTGTLNEAGLSAALVATGLTPIQVAAWVVQAAGQRVGTLQPVFGLQMSPSESKLLRQRVADLTKQRELQMLSDIQYVQGLQALKIPPTWVNALRAGANAALKPKTAAVLTPVTIP